MRQAKVPTEQEFRRLLAVAAQSAHAARNRAALMLSYYAGLRVGEIAALSIVDVYDQGNQVRDQIMLRAEITKTKEARAVFVGDKLRKELERYRDSWTGTQPKPARALLRSQKGAAFSATRFASYSAGFTTRQVSSREAAIPADAGSSPSWHIVVFRQSDYDPGRTQEPDYNATLYRGKRCNDGGRCRSAINRSAANIDKRRQDRTAGTQSAYAGKRLQAL